MYVLTNFSHIFVQIFSRFDLGDGVVTLKSSNKLELRRFYSVTLSRFNQQGLMKIEGIDEVKGESTGKLKSLDLKQPMYLGNVPESTPGYVINDVFICYSIPLPKLLTCYL